MIEMALSFPFLLLLLVAILFFGRYFLITQVLLYAAQEGAENCFSDTGFERRCCAQHGAWV